MGKKLTASNPYLSDPVKRKNAVFLTVSSSSAIEGIYKPFKRAGGKLISENRKRAKSA